MRILLFYDPAQGKGAIGTLDANAFTTTKELPAGSFSQWTHVVASGPTVLCYNQRNGVAAFGTLTPTGFTTDLELHPGSFGTWTNIVPTAAGWLFYDRYTGAAAVGTYLSAGLLKQFVTTISLPRESFRVDAHRSERRLRIVLQPTQRKRCRWTRHSRWTYHNTVLCPRHFRSVDAHRQ
jgi:hypothetical protein